jgi:hypothetical protein
MHTLAGLQVVLVGSNSEKLAVSLGSMASKPCFDRLPEKSTK